MQRWSQWISKSSKCYLWFVVNLQPLSKFGPESNDHFDINHNFYAFGKKKTINNRLSITLLLLSTLFFHRPISTSVVSITKQINRRVESTIWKLAPIGCRLANFKMNFKNQPSSFSIQLSNAWCIKVANPKKNISKSSVLLLTFHFSSFEKGWTYQPWPSPPAPYHASHIDNAVDNNQPSLSLPEWCFL